MIDKEDIQVEINDMPEFVVAGIRHIGPYKGNSALFQSLFGKLMSWAGPKELVNHGTEYLTIYHDNPETVPEDQQRISVCITIPEDAEVDGEIEKSVVPAGRYAFAYCEIYEDEYEEAWNLFVGSSLPEIGFRMDEGLCYERYLNNPGEHPEHLHIVELCVPVKPI